MKMKLLIEQFPMDSLDYMKSELKRYAECTVDQLGANNILISCDADVVKCMEVLVIADKFNINQPAPS